MSMSIQADAVLDFVEFQLFLPRNRCEVYISANGVTEKLASGFLKPFLTHLQIVEKQAAQGCNSAWLEHPEFLDAKSWFTKETINRFVRFVNTPEVLERAKSIEDELVQLQQVRSIQFNSLFNAEKNLPGCNNTWKRDDCSIHLKALEKQGSLRVPRKCAVDTEECSGEESKVELLRAMDLRVHVLQQEQRCALDRAVAAGFSNQDMVDLVAFSEHFGANRFRTACIEYMNLLRAKHKGDKEPNFMGKNGELNQDKKVPLKLVVSKASQGYKYETVGHNKAAMALVTENMPLNNRAPGVLEARKRWGPPENIRMELFVNPNDTDSISSNESSQTALIEESPQTESLPQKKTTKQDIHQKVNVFQCIVDEKTSSAQAQNTFLPSHVSCELMQSPECQPNCIEGKAYSDARSQIPCQSIHSNGVAPRCTMLSGDVALRENIGHPYVNGNSLGTNEKGDDGLGLEAWSPPVVASARRLSVQDAISLFENKQTRNLAESGGKHCFSKPEKGRASFEGAGTFLSGREITKRRDSRIGSEASTGLQEMGSFSQPTATVLESDPVLSVQFPDDSLQRMHTAFSTESVSDAPVKASIDAQLKPSTNCALRNGKMQEQYSTTEVANGVNDSNRHEQPFRQLEKSFTKDHFTTEVSAEVGWQEHAAFLNMRTQNFDQSLLSTELVNIPAASLPSSGKKSKKAVAAKTNAVSPFFAHGHCPLLQNDTESSESAQLDVNRALDLSSKGHDTNEFGKRHQTTENSTEHYAKRESLGSCLVNPSDVNAHAVALSVNNKRSWDVKVSEGSKGRLYEQYSKVRDAKLREEQALKGAEREVKLKILEESLKKQKAEMDASATRFSRKGHYRSCPIKDGDDRVLNLMCKDSSVKSRNSTLSPPSTPCITKKAPSLRSQGGKKSVVTSQKSAIPCSASHRSSPWASPKMAPKLTTGSAQDLRKSIALNRGESPLSKSVPCFSSLRKENTKPSVEHSIGSARVHPKNGSSGHVTPGMMVTSFESHSNASACTSLACSGPVKEGKKPGSTALRKNYISAKNVRALAVTNDVGVSVPHKSQRQVISDTAALSSFNSNAISSLPAKRPFLRKGHGTGQRMDADVLKPEVSLEIDSAKSSVEDRAVISKSQTSSNDDSNQMEFPVSEEMSSLEVSDGGNRQMHDDAESPLSNNADKQTVEASAISGSNNVVELYGSAPINAPTTERVLGVMDHPQSISCSSTVDLEIRNGNPDVLPTQSNVNFKCCPDYSILHEGRIEALSKHDQKFQPDEACLSLCSLHSPQEPLLPLSSPAASWSASSTAAHEEQLNSHSGPKLQSSVGSPLTWSLSQADLVETAMSDKNWVNFEKSNMASQTKDSIKGFRRLLKFGRTNRASEVSNGDFNSAASATSADDDELEEKRLFVEVISSRGRVCDRRHNDKFKGHIRAKEKGSAQSFKSSPSAPVSNFKMHDNYMEGGALMSRAPRAFFSLSSFRNKVGEGRLPMREPV